MRNSPAIPLSLAVALMSALALADVRQQDGDIVMENEFIRVTLVPKVGGKAKSFFLKAANLEVTEWPKYGAIEDRLWLVKGYDLPTKSYDAKVVDAGPERNEVLMTARPSTPGYDCVQVEKRVVLLRGAPRLDVHYRFVNAGATVTPWGFWIANDMAARGEETLYMMPADDGMDLMYWPGHGRSPMDDPRNATTLTAEKYVYDNPRGFQALLGTKSKAGVALVVPLRYLSFLYEFNSPTVCTFEAGFNKVEIPPGKSLEMTIHYLALAGMEAVSGAAAEAAADLVVPAKAAEGDEVKVAVRLFAAEAGEYELQAGMKALGGEGERLEQTQRLALTPGGAKEVVFTFRPKTPSTFAVTCAVTRAGKTVIVLEKPVVVGVETARWTWTPDVEARIGQEMSGYRHSTRKVMLDPAVKFRLANEIGLFERPSAEVKTFSIPLAKPFAGRKPRVLFCPRVLRERDVVDLTNAFDLDWDYCPLCRDSDYEFLFQGSQRTLYYPCAETLRKKLKENRYDAIVMANSVGMTDGWAATPKDLKDSLTSAVREGTTLIYAGHSPTLAAELTPLGAKFQSAPLPLVNRVFCTQPAAMLAMWSRAAGYGYQVAPLGKGNVVNYLFTGGGYWRSCSFLTTEDAVTRNAATGQDPLRGARFEMAQAVAVHSLGNLVYHYAGCLPETPVLIECGGGKAAWGAPVRFRPDPKTWGDGAQACEIKLYDMQGVERCSKTLRLVAAEPLEMTAAGLEAGDYLALARSLDGQGRVVNWGRAALEVTTPAEVKVTPARGSYGKGEIAEAVVEAGHCPDRAALRLRVWDQHDRLIHEAAKPLEGESGRAVFRFSTREVLTKMIALEGAVTVDGRPVRAARQEVAVRLRRDTPFRVAPYGQFMDQCRDQLGVDSFYAWPQTAALHNLDSVLWIAPPEGFDLRPALQTSVLTRNPCLTSEAWRAASVKALTEPAYMRESKDFENLGVIWADEWSYGGRNNDEINVCHSPTCLAGFREYLRGEYGTLDALNRSWGSSYNDWDAVAPPRVEDVKQAPRKWAAAWSDHRTYTDNVVRNYFHFLNREFRNVHPDGRVGLSGTRNPGCYTGMDWWKICQSNDYLSIYGGAQVFLANSFRRPGSALSRWGWYDTRGTNTRMAATQVWEFLFDGFDIYSAYHTMCFSMMRGDYTLRPSARVFQAEARRIQDGIGHLFRESAADACGVALYYSQRSLHAARLLGYEGLPVDEIEFNNNLVSFGALFRNLGVGFEAVAYEQVENGVLRDHGVRLLALPLSQSFSPIEAERVRQFVAEGGVLVADVLAGFRDGHAKPARPSLDDVFGVDQGQGRLIFEAGPVRVNGLTLAGRPVPAFNLDARRGNADLRLAGGRALASFADKQGREVPALVVKRFGKGWAVCLNFVINDYGSYAAAGVGGEVSVVREAKAEKRRQVGDVFRHVMELAGVQPKVRLLDGAEAFVDATPYLYRNGDTQYVGVLWAGGETPKTIRVEFACKAHVYDVTERRHLSEAQAVDVELRPASARVLALLPHPVRGMASEADSPAGLGKSAELRLSRDSACEDAAYALVEVFRPDGVEAKWLRRVVRLVRNSAATGLPFALNDPKGTWRIRATEVVSGAVAEAALEVR